jgi:integron integrase
MANAIRSPPVELCARMETILRTRHYSPRTTKCYLYWVRKFLNQYWFCRSEDLGEREVSRFLSDLAVRGNVAASTQNQALSAILFLFQHVLGRELDWLDGVARARRSQHLPVVLSKLEVQKVLGQMAGTPRLVAELLYGSGLRLMECLRLRVKDLHFDQLTIMVRDGKGRKDRATVLPGLVETRLHQHLARVRRLHAKDLLAGAGFVELPHALARKYPRAASSWPYQWIFHGKRFLLV